MNRAVFLDRDGVLVEERNYLCRIEDVLLLPSTGPALWRLKEAGFKLFVVTNQSGVGRGYFTMADVDKVNAHIAGELARNNVAIERFYVAPEAPDQSSRGRKPSPRFLFDARDEFGLDLPTSYMIGDKLIDLECGWNAGVRASILVRTGYGSQLEQTAPEKLIQAVVVDDLSTAAEWILNQDW